MLNSQYRKAVAILGLLSAITGNELYGQRPIGIDVSSYQGASVNWTSVKSSGRTFAWAKATEATGTADADFTINESNGKAAGIYMGAYHFAHPELDTPASEAAYFWSKAGGYILADNKTLMPMLDYEEFGGVTGASTDSAWANDFCIDIQQDAVNAGVAIKPFIYISACKGSYFDTSIAQWFSDIANYGSVDGNNDAQTGTPWSSCADDDVWGSGVWHMWQYASAPADGSVSGVSGNCDVDVYNGTLAQLTNNCLATVSGSGAIYYWDPQGTTGANPYTSSMTGTWETTKWSGAASGQAAPIAWVEGKAACIGVHTGIGTPAFTITLNSDHLVAGFFDGALTPDASTVTLTGSGVINLASGAQALDVKNASDGSSASLTFNTSINGDGQLVPEGTGQAYLNASNNFTGGLAMGYSTVPFSGIVNFNNGAAFGTGRITFQSVGTGGALVLEGSSAVTLPNSVTIASTTTNNIVGNAAGLTFSGPWTVSAAASIGSGGAASSLITISGAISGSSTLTKYNPGILSLNGANTYTGSLVVSAGTLTIGGSGWLGGGSYAGAVSDAGTFIYGSSAAQNMSGVISGAGAVKQTAGYLTLSGANTYTGVTTLSGGRVTLNHAETASTSGPLGKAAANSLGSIVLSGGTLQYSPANNADYSGRFSPAASQMYNIDVNGRNVTFATALNSSGGTLNVFSTNGGALELTAVNSYSGLTSVDGGTLQLGIANSISSNSSVLISNSATFDMNGFSDAIANLGGVLGAAAPAGNVINDNGTLTITGTTGTNIGEVGSAAYSGIISGSGNVVVAGGGDTTFSGSNTYAGATTVTGGTLISSFNGALPATSPLTVNTPGIFDLVSVSETVPSLAGTGTINLGSGNLTVGNSNASTSFGGVIQNFPVPFTNGSSTNGLLGYYYPAINFSGTPILRMDPNVAFSDFTQSAQNPLYPQTNEFSVRWVGQVATGTGGTYTFATTSDDGSRCWVNGQIVVDNWAFQGATNRTGTITLSSNALYDIRVEYMQGSVTASCALSWMTPDGTNLVTIPTGNLWTYGGTGGLIVTGTNTLTLNGTNSYAGATIITGGTLALGSTGSINGSTNISLAAGGTLDVSAINSFAMSPLASLTASGSTAPAILIGGNAVALGAQPIVLNFDGTNPPLTVSQGTLSLGGNSFTVNGAPLSNGVYVLIQAATNIIDGGNYTVSGSVFAATPANGAISVTGNTVVLTITNASTSIALNPLSPITYPASANLVATVTPAPNTGTVQFYDNGSALGGPVAVAGGTAIYTTATLSVGDHPITASYSGGFEVLASSTTNATIQTVMLAPNSAPVTITGAVRLANGMVQMSFSGIPGYTYTIQGTTNLIPPIQWTNVGTATADTNGQFYYTDLSATNYSSQYYQTAVPQE